MRISDLGSAVGSSDLRRTRLGAAVVPGFGDRSRRHLADDAGGAGLLRSPACGCAGRSGGRRRNGRPRCRLSRGSGCRKARWPGKPARLRNRRQQKTRRRPGFSTVATTRPAGRAKRGQAVWSALMRAVRRLLWRAALFLWGPAGGLDRSSSGWGGLKGSSAPTASLASSALRTFLTEVRSIERCALLRQVRTPARLPRFLEDLVFVPYYSLF